MPPRGRPWVTWHGHSPGRPCSFFLPFVALFKWLLLGRYVQRAAPDVDPVLAEAATNLYEGIAVPNFLRYLRARLAAFGAEPAGLPYRPGVYLDTTDITEFDCVTIGDYSGSMP